ncbi:DMT family transporter [Gymnodinialimonas sp. 57CJ19]|uniref:DMT family transporter n=1 Tax=Gymnodinialimonas sp. 57CJ19 TaxID=3138498 RepID=UPI0031344CD4
MDKNTLRALPLMLLAMALIPAGDTAGKLLSAGVGTGGVPVAPIFIAWSRFAIGALMIAPFVAHLVEPRLFTDWRVWLRGFLVAGGITSILTALSTEPIANVFGAFFVGPIVSWLLSVWLLREPFSAPRFGLICLGFVGVILVVKPGFGMTPGMGFAVLAGLFYGCYLVMSRWMANIARPRALLFSQLVIGALILSVPGIWAMPSITAPVVGLTLISAACSMLGNLLLIIAYRRAEASRMAPFVYSQLIWATLLGALVFDALPDGLALAGIVLVLASGFASLAVRERPAA